MLLLGDGAGRGAFPDSAPLQEITKLNQRRDRDPWRTDRHPAAGALIEHPRRDRQHLTGADLHVDDIAPSATLHVLAMKTASVEGVPPVMNLDDLPDMGRMTQQWP